MDFTSLPPRSLPTPSPLLSPNLALLDQWLRLNIGYLAGTAVLAPILRGVILQIGEREHLRQHRIKRDLSSNPLRYTSPIIPLKAVVSEEGWRSLYRGSGALFSAIPIRSTLHVLLFNLIEQQASQGDNSSFLESILYPFDSRNSPYRSRNGDESDESKKSSNSPRMPLTGVAGLDMPHQRTSGQRRRAYLAQCAWLIGLGELLLYPTQYLFTAMASDLPGPDRMVQTNKISRLLLSVLQKDGLWAIYRGFFPATLAVGVPAMIYANHRFSHYEEKAKEEMEERLKEEKERNRRVKSLEKYSSPDDEISTITWKKDGKAVTLLVEPESELDRRMKEMGVKRNEHESVYFNYALLLGIMYPFYVSSVRMIVGNAQRTPSPVALPFLSVERWPKLRLLLAKLLPMSASLRTESFIYTLQRVTSAGPAHTFAGMWALVAGASIASIFSSSLALLSSLPLTAYLNDTILNSSSLLTSSGYLIETEAYQTALEKHQRISASKLFPSRHHPSVTGENTSSSPSSSKRRQDGSLEGQDSQNSASSIYDDSDAALARLGLQTRQSSHKKVYSNGKDSLSRDTDASDLPADASPLQILNASLSPRNLAVKNSLGRDDQFTPLEIINFDLDAESLVSPSARSHASQRETKATIPSKSPSSTPVQSYSENRAAGGYRDNAPLPLLSQKKKRHSTLPPQL